MFITSPDHSGGRTALIRASLIEGRGRGHNEEARCHLGKRRESRATL